MSIEWAGLGPELLLRLNRTLPEPLGFQLVRELREAIRSGRLVAGERLPSSRMLAAELGVSRGLVLDCYQQLQAEGFLTSRGGSATRVAAGAYAPPAPLARAAPAPRLAVDFRPGVPDLSSFPRSDWLWALRDAARQAPAEAFDYGDPRGSPALREVLAAYLRRVRGAVADPEHLVICTGFAQGVNLVLAALASSGVQRVAIEDPGDVDYLATAGRAGMRAVPVRVDHAGVDVAALAAGDARAVILTPAHQAPTGVVLAPHRRQALVAWANHRVATIIEDDYDAEFRYDREPVGALQGLAPERVALVGSASKALAPSIRLGWIICPPGLTDAIAGGKERADRGSPALDQLALASLIQSGRYDRHLRRMRASYARRREALADTLARQAPQVELHGLAAGFHAVAHLPDGLSELAVVAAARARSVGLYGMSRYRLDGSTSPPRLVLGFGNLREGAIARGVATIGDLLRDGG